MPPPSVPILINPSDVSLISDNTPAFDWSGTAGSGGTYTLEYATDEAFTENLVTHSGLTDTSFTPATGLSDGTWYWHVQAHNSGGGSGYQGSPFSFSIDTEAPDIPVLLTPSDGSSTNDLTPEFSWTSTGDSYTLEYSQDESFTSGVTTVEDLTETSYTPGTALPEGEWYWHVEAYDQVGNGSGYQTVPFSFTLDTEAPSAPTDFTVLPGHEKCKLSWSNPSGIAGIEIRRNPWEVGAYPEYDDDYPTPLGYPADETEGDLVYQGLSESYVDSANTTEMPRNVYYYTIFAYDEAGNYSAASTAQQGRATNYWLGDVSGDGNVYYEDLTILSVCYWTLDGDAGYNAEFDIGPTVTSSSRGIPATDNAINFEDLILFAINYGDVGPNQKVVPILPEHGVRGALSLSLERDPGILKEGDEFAVRVVLKNNPGTIKGIHLQIPYDQSELELLEVSKSAAISEGSELLFFDGREKDSRVDLSLALLGQGNTMGGSGELAAITFRLVKPGELSLCFEEVDLRDLTNRKLEADLQDMVAAHVASLPREYSLSQNRPNPFNLETVISYQLPSGGHVSLKIYNIQGQLVRTLVSEYHDAGVHTITWDGKNDQGQEIASGVYLYRLEAGNYSNTKKMSLLK